MTCEWAIQALTDATQMYYITLAFREIIYSADKIQLLMCPEASWRQKLRAYKHYATLAELESAVPNMEHYFGKFCYLQ